MSESDVTVYAVVGDDLVPADSNVNQKLARPPTSLMTSVAQRFGKDTAYVLVVIWHYAVLNKFRPFNFGRSKYSTWGLGYTGVRSAIGHLTDAKVIQIEQQGRRALRIIHNNKVPVK